MSSETKNVRQQTEEYSEQAREKADEYREKAAERIGDGAVQAADRIDRAADVIRDTAETSADFAQRTGARVSEGMHTAATKLRKGGERVRPRNPIRRHPLLAVAGIALGGLMLWRLFR